MALIALLLNWLQYSELKRSILGYRVIIIVQSWVYTLCAYFSQSHEGLCLQNVTALLIFYVLLFIILTFLCKIQSSVTLKIAGPACGPVKGNFIKTGSCLRHFAQSTEWSRVLGCGNLARVFSLGKCLCIHFLACCKWTVCMYWIFCSVILNCLWYSGFFYNIQLQMNQYIPLKAIKLTLKDSFTSWQWTSRGQS